MLVGNYTVLNNGRREGTWWESIQYFKTITELEDLMEIGPF